MPRMEKHLGLKKRGHRKKKSGENPSHEKITTIQEVETHKKMKYTKDPLSSP
jgi:hypothetical protein